MEWFDIYDEADRRIGIASREEVHARGLWHHTFHCWLVRLGTDGRARVLFQQRSDKKDTHPGKFDITAAGHLTAGETPKEAAREIEEELGLAVSFEQLVPYGTIRGEVSGMAGGRTFVDREVNHVFGLVTELPPQRFRLQEEEVAGLYEADAIRLIALMEGREDIVQAEGVRMRNGTAMPCTVPIRSSAFVPREKTYYIGVFDFLKKLTEAQAD